MRTIPLILATAALTTMGVTVAPAQEAGAEITLTGCLAEEKEEGEEVEYFLENVADEEIAAGKIELEPEEGVNLGPHVGHTVEVTGVVVAEGEEDAAELEIRVTDLGHIAASCEKAR